MNLIRRADRKYRSDGLRGVVRDGTHFLVERSILPLQRRKLWPFNNDVYNNDGVLLAFDDPVFTEDMKKSIILGQFGPNRAWVTEIVSHITAAEMDVIEIGAGSGFMSCMVNKQLSSQYMHIAIEANPNLIQTLERTRTLNSADYVILNKAYAPNQEEIEFKVYEDYKSGTPQGGRGQPTDVITVPATSLREVSDDLEIDEFVLYSNMEGMEFEMIDTELDFIKSHCPLVVISFHDFTDHDETDYIETMDNHFAREWDNGLGTIVYRNQSSGPQ